MKLVHTNREKWHVNTDKIFIQGSSAGGHLAASLGVFWNQPFLCELSGTTPEILKPCGMILCYPVITSEEEYAHEGSFKSLLGSRYEELKDRVSIEKQVTSAAPPCFIWHTFTDETVPVENALLFVQALRKAGVSTEFHMYPAGEHGLSLGDQTSARTDGSMICEPVQSWIHLLETWLKGMTD